MQNVPLSPIMTITQVQKQLQQMVDTDQEARKDYPKKKAGVAELNKQHSDQIAKIIDEFGVIDVERFGEETARNAAMIVQHSSLEVKQRYLKLQEDFDQTKIYKRGYVYLKDRILIAEGKPQLYGTQMKVLNKQGDLAFNPIEDFENIDDRRAEMGLETFEEYLNSVEKNLGKRPAILEQGSV